MNNNQPVNGSDIAPDLFTSVPKSTKPMTQNEAVLRYINETGSITSFEAFTEFGITRLSARIYELGKDNHYFEKENVTRVNRFGHHVTFVKYKKLNLTT